MRSPSVIFREPPVLFAGFQMKLLNPLHHRLHLALQLRNSVQHILERSEVGLFRKDLEVSSGSEPDDLRVLAELRRCLDITSIRSETSFRRKRFPLALKVRPFEVQLTGQVCAVHTFSRMGQELDRGFLFGVPFLLWLQRRSIADCTSLGDSCRGKSSLHSLLQ